jgi:site-specific DNA-methyltransferase (cytosine-N4-specific)
VVERFGVATRLARLHPYPAMVADELAVSLSEELISPGDRVLDPFCGSGRFLCGAVQMPGERIGFDINPLACLITQAKLSRASHSIFRSFAASLPEECDQSLPATNHEFDFSRRVDWFSRQVLHELSAVVHFINDSDLAQPERQLAAAILSATTRQCSYARTDSWKLHRINEERRKTHSRSPISVFRKRVIDCVEELERESDVRCASTVFNQSLRETSLVEPGSVDLVMTSPPYGDSRTTVQYGAVSDLSLAVLRHVQGLGINMLKVGEIDRKCLGGKIRRNLDNIEINDYWAGASASDFAHRLRSFLEDYADHCRVIADALKPGGKAVFVLSRRSLGGYRVKLDQYTIDLLARFDISLLNIETRAVKGKRLPYRINRFAAAKDANRSSVGSRPTMNEELVLHFQKAHAVNRMPLVNRAC